MGEQAGKRRCRWPDVAAVASVAVLTFGLAVWMMQNTAKGAAILPYLIFLPAGLTAYWTVPREPTWRPVASWSETTLPMAFGWAIVVAILLVPALLGLLQRAVPPQRTA